MNLLKESLLEELRRSFSARLPNSLMGKIAEIAPLPDGGAAAVDPEVKELLPSLQALPPLRFERGARFKVTPRRVAVLFSGGQAPGGHNVITGLYDALVSSEKDSRLLGFLDGPAGLLEGRYLELTEELLKPYRNQGGFDLLGSGRTKIETQEQFERVAALSDELKLDALVIIGGDDSNTNAALLADYLAVRGKKSSIIGIPKTIDGDLRGGGLEASFGFDTATKSYSETIGSIQRDCLSAKKYTHFIRLMGRSASHITLECALATHPNLALIGEEAAAQEWSLSDIVAHICDLIEARAERGKRYATLLIPEGLLEFLPDCRTLIRELNSLLAPKAEHAAAIEALDGEGRLSYAYPFLTEPSRNSLQAMPKEIQKQLLLDRDPHGNVQLSKIETERLLIAMAKKELARRRSRVPLHPQPHFLGYEGRCCFPSNFDANYCYALGVTAALLALHDKSGYLAAIKNLAAPPEEWIPYALPLAAMMAIELRRGAKKPVIKKALVDLQGTPFRLFAEQRARWALEDDYRYPGPPQYFGPSELVDATTHTLALESSLTSAH